MKNYTAILCFLLFLFCLRVVGQILVAFFHVDFLPPMDQWYSGLLPYPILLICQFLIVGIFAKICFDLCRKSGYFARKKPRLGAFLVTFSYFYYSAMVIRYNISHEHSSHRSVVWRHDTNHLSFRPGNIPNPVWTIAKAKPIALSCRCRKCKCLSSAKYNRPLLYAVYGGHT